MADENEEIKVLSPSKPQIGFCVLVNKSILCNKNWVGYITDPWGTPAMTVVVPLQILKNYKKLIL